ncbi:hypothetical protein GZH53_15820 [Flavihumibacter sp. R14]|nr:hypothetical protein [Flavihumibacter soli]
MNIIIIVIVFAVIGAIVVMAVGDETSMKKKALGGAFMGILTLLGLLVKVVVPILILMALFKACF